MSESYARLEPYLIMSRSTKGAAAAKIVGDVTGAVSSLPTSAGLDLADEWDGLRSSRGYITLDRCCRAGMSGLCVLRGKFRGEPC